MAWRWGTCFAVALVLTSGRAHAQSPDSVKLANQNGTEQSGVLAWGKEGMPNGMGVSPVSINAALTSGETNQAVAFTKGRPPALDSDVPWTGSSDTIQLDYPTPYKIPIKIWVLCVDDDCTSAMPASRRAELDQFFVWWNERFLAEHVGITLDAGADWIVDKTGLTGNASTFFWDFVTSNCKDLVSKARSLEMRQEGAFNVYIVRTVNTYYRDGNFCYTHDSAVLGSYALIGTMLHEICHDLGLWHIDGKTWEKKVGGKKNLMSGDSTRRKSLTEGQLFRMHFASNSGLNFELKASLPTIPPTNPPQERTPRDCADDGPPKLRCPPEDTMLWKD